MLGELNRRLKADYDLSVSAATVLAIIDGAGEPITPGVIAERAIIAAASTTSVLDTLEKRGLVERRPHPTDRRKLLIDLTATDRISAHASRRFWRAGNRNSTAFGLRRTSACRRRSPA